VIAAMAARIARLPRAALLGGAGAAVLAGAALAPDLGPAAARAALVAAGLGAAAALAWRRAAGTADPAPLAVVARASLGRDTGVALLDVDGARVLVGFGPHGVQRLDGPRDEGSAP
jgi:hypothetical protein